jgi:hypothetical protein
MVITQGRTYVVALPVLKDPCNASLNLHAVHWFMTLLEKNYRNGIIHQAIKFINNAWMPGLPQTIAEI